MAVSQSPGATYRPGPLPKVWGQVPQQNMNFTGREELLVQLRAGITTEVTAVVPHALHGLGGVGKTQVAIEYAWRHRSEYDVVWWIPADQPVLVRSSLAALAPHLGLPPATATGIEDAATAVLNALQRGEPHANWLLIFDNADQPEDINDLVPRGPGHVLITSRNHRWQGVVDTVAVDVFSRTESAEFLTKRLKAVSVADAERLAQELGDLPLALEQAGALQTETGMSVDEYLRLLEEQTSRLLAESKPSEYGVSMTAAWALSVSQLTDKLPEAVELLRCCAFFGPEPIPRDVFQQRGGSRDSKLSRILSDPILLARALRELGRFALARIDSPGRTIQVHRLIQALLRDELSTEDQDRFRHEVHMLLVGAAGDEPDATEGWPRYSDLVAHVNPSKVAGCQDPAVRRFALNVVRYLYMSGSYEIGRGYVDRFLHQWTTVSGADHPDVLAARQHLGLMLRELGDYPAAYDLNRKTLRRMTEILGPEHPETLRATLSHGADLRARGDFADAREHDEDSRIRHESAFGAEDARTLRAMNNLALDYGLTSDYERARELHLTAFRLQQQYETTPQVSKVDVLASWTGLSRAVRLCGDYAEARDVGEDAYSYGHAEVGAEHLRTLWAAKDLSIAQRRAGAVTEALELAKDVHSRLTRLFGEDHPDTLGAAMSLANVMRSAGHVDAAFELAEDTVRRYPRVYGEDHPYNYGCAGNLALLRRVRGDVTGARDLDQSALDGLVARLGQDHHYALTVATNLASDLAVLGETAEARELGEDSLRRLRSVLGEDHPMTLGCAANLVIDRKADGAGQEADSLFEETIQGYHRTLGPDHPDTKVAMLQRRVDFDFDPPPI
jgi:tetratricopeptide (TPR) repeat protein